MPLALLMHGLSRRRRPERALPATPDLKHSYDVVIIGGGGHGLAAAHYLATRHGITDVAVLEKSWLGGGNTARNTAIVRANYLTPEGVRFYAESMELFRGLSGELGFNILYTERGHLTLAHTDATLRTARWRAEVNKHLGVESPRSTSISGSSPGSSVATRSRASAPGSTCRATSAIRFSARFIIRPAPSRATTRWPGATPSPPRARVSRFIRKPKSPASKR